ncbi:UDP-glycosyltransferase 73C2-like [Typha angustifolia]|uniref:UDP-glycosyltransferase 73C2-like n=1 Tax=Typha angustifolia TaxID=59011 RepID=UPI003C2C9923
MVCLGEEEAKPHFVLVPLVAQGHMIPMVDMARLLAEHGARVSLITTPVNAARIKPIIDHASRANLPIRFVELRFPCKEIGIPDGCENVDLITDQEAFKPFFDAMSSFQSPLEDYILAQDTTPTCIISDGCNPWTMEVASRLGIPRFVFHGPSCFYVLCDYNIMRHNLYKLIVDPLEPFLVPDLPVRVEVNKLQAPGFFNQPGWEKLCDHCIEAEKTADAILINTFDDLEHPFIERYSKSLEKKVWPIGPLCLYNKDVDSKATRGNIAAIDQHRVITWLDTKEANSVIYVSFGSLARHQPLQIIEIGSGLEASKKPFIWVIKEAEMVPEVEKWIKEEFEEKTKERGLIVKGWSPQLAILSHAAVGGLVTHCGWNSMLESISNGVPLVTWPHFADQFLNEKLVVDVLRVGVSLGVKSPCYFTDVDGSTAEVVKREDIAEAVSRLMDGGEEGREMRERAKEFGDKAKKAMEEGGSSHVNMNEMIQFVMEQSGKQGCLLNGSVDFLA